MKLLAQKALPTQKNYPACYRENPPLSQSLYLSIPLSRTQP